MVFYKCRQIFSLRLLVGVVGLKGVVGNRGLNVVYGGSYVSVVWVARRERERTVTGRRVLKMTMRPIILTAVLNFYLPKTKLLLKFKVQKQNYVI